MYFLHHITKLNNKLRKNIRQEFHPGLFWLSSINMCEAGALQLIASDIRRVHFLSAHLQLSAAELFVSLRLSLGSVLARVRAPLLLLYNLSGFL